MTLGYSRLPPLTLVCLVVPTATCRALVAVMMRCSSAVRLFLLLPGVILSPFAAIGLVEAGGCHETFDAPPVRRRERGHSKSFCPCAPRSPPALMPPQPSPTTACLKCWMRAARRSRLRAADVPVSAAGWSLHLCGSTPAKIARRPREAPAHRRHLRNVAGQFVYISMRIADTSTRRTPRRSLAPTARPVCCGAPS